MVLEAEHGVEVVCGDLDRGLADLVGGLGNRMPVPFEHDDRKVRKSLAQLQRQRQAREASAENCDVRLHQIVPIVPTWRDLTS